MCFSMGNPWPYKKTDKTPPGDIERAGQIRKLYFELKTSGDEK